MQYVLLIIKSFRGPFIISDILLIVSFVICFYAFIVSISNFFCLKKVKSNSITFQEPKISILIPCRNEEDNVENVINSMVNQSYENIEVILLDDSSSDNTAQIISKFSKKFSKIKYVTGLQLKKGWIGKNWACHQLTKIATGDYFLFCDADVIYDKDLVRDSIANLKKNDYKFLTLFPGRKSDSITDKFIWSFAGWAINAWLPFIITFKTNISLLAAGFGQFLLIDKETYFKIGGHKSFKNTQLDDFELSRLVQQSGDKWSVAIASNRVITKGYSTFTESINGHGRSIMPVFHNNGIIMFLFWCIISNTIFFPIFLSINSVINSDYSNLNSFLSFCNIFFIFISWILTSFKTKVNIIPCLIYPLTTFLILFVAIHSLYKTKKRIIFWKDRLIS